MRVDRLLIRMMQLDSNMRIIYADYPVTDIKYTMIKSGTGDEAVAGTLLLRDSVPEGELDEIGSYVNSPCRLTLYREQFDIDEEQPTLKVTVHETQILRDMYLIKFDRGSRRITFTCSKE